MITIITGRPRNGKGLKTNRIAWEELTQGKRCIVTNFAFRPGELAALLVKRGRDDVDLLMRLRMLDEQETKSFFLHREHGVNIEPVTKREEEAGIFPKIDEAQKATGGSVLYIIDEAHIHFDSRCWQAVGRSLTFYASQHGKFDDNVIFVTQHCEQLEKRLRLLANEYIECRNYGLQRFLQFWRGPSRFLALTTYKQPPCPPEHREIFSVDPELDSCFDTTAGVGVSGGRERDTTRAKGLPIWTFAFPLAALAVILFWGPDVVAFGFSRLLGKLTGEKAAVTQRNDGRGPASALPDAKLGPARSGEPVGDPISSSLHSLTSDGLVWARGVVWRGRRAQVLLADGRTLDGDDIREIRPNYVLLRDGTRAWLQVAGPGHPEPQSPVSVPPPAPLYQYPDTGGAWVTDVYGVSHLRSAEVLRPR